MSITFSFHELSISVERIRQSQVYKTYLIEKKDFGLSNSNSRHVKRVQNYC